MVDAGQVHESSRGWYGYPQVSRLLQIYAYALRAKGMVGKTRAQSREAKAHRSQFYEDVWREAAGELDATVEPLANGILEIRRGAVSTRVHDNCTPLDDPVTLRIALNKPLVHKTLRRHHLPTPSFAEFTLGNLDKAHEFLAEHPHCVVKPADGTGGGDGVTTGIETRGQVLRAAVRAAGFCPKLLIEEEVEGNTIRLLYLDGKLLDAVQRNSPTLMGDGQRKISELVDRLNERRLSAGYKLAQVTLRYDMDMKRTLERQGLSWRSVPADGRRVLLKRVVNDNMADENLPVADRVSESVVAAGQRAAELLGATLVGVDVITPDIQRSLEDANGKIIEINTTPGLHYHYFKQGGACRVAVPILEACLEHAHACH
jgi:glutathione synthase/RimK-type ligase-like ATP-grasp enzyme